MPGISKDRTVTHQNTEQRPLKTQAKQPKYKHRQSQTFLCIGQHFSPLQKKRCIFVIK